MDVFLSERLLLQILHHCWLTRQDVLQFLRGIPQFLLAVDQASIEKKIKHLQTLGLVRPSYDIEETVNKTGSARAVKDGDLDEDEEGDWGAWKRSAGKNRESTTKEEEDEGSAARGRPSSRQASKPPLRGELERQFGTAPKKTWTDETEEDDSRKPPTATKAPSSDGSENPWSGLS